MKTLEIGYDENRTMKQHLRRKRKETEFYTATETVPPAIELDVLSQSMRSKGLVYIESKPGSRSALSRDHKVGMKLSSVVSRSVTQQPHKIYSVLLNSGNFFLKTSLVPVE